MASLAAASGASPARSPAGGRIAFAAQALSQPFFNLHDSGRTDPQPAGDVDATCRAVGLGQPAKDPAGFAAGLLTPQDLSVVDVLPAGFGRVAFAAAGQDFRQRQILMPIARTDALSKSFMT